MAISRLEGIEDALSTWVAAKAVELEGDAPELPPEDRPDRALVAPGCRLKHNDHVVVNGQCVRVIRPGRLSGWFYAAILMDGAFAYGQWEAQYVTDRAPADPEEDPLPIFEEPSP